MLNVTRPLYEVAADAKVVKREFTDELQRLLAVLAEAGTSGEEIRVGSGWCSAYVEVRRERAYSFQVTIEEATEDRFASRDYRRTPEGDVVKLVNLHVNASWSSLGTVSGADALAFAERLGAMVARVKILLGAWLDGKQLAVIHATAEEEAQQLEDAAVSRLVKLAWETLPDNKKNLRAPRTVTCLDLADYAGRTFEVYLTWGPKVDGKRGNFKSEVLVGEGGKCVISKPAPKAAEGVL
ncbi:MAG: hypothetical protein ABFD77_02740 [Thermotogota bacterium]